MARLLEPDLAIAGDVSGRFVGDDFDRPGADTPLDRALRLDTEVMLVDDPVIDRRKGSSPVPALTHLEGEAPELVDGTLHSPCARDRGLFRRAYVDELPAEPNCHLTLNGSKPRQLGALEMWLQAHGV